MTLVNGIVAPELKSEAVKVNGEDLAGEVHARATRLLRATLSADSSPHRASEQQGSAGIL
jgi:hypothetical protein